MFPLKSLSKRIGIPLKGLQKRIGTPESLSTKKRVAGIVDFQCDKDGFNQIFHSDGVWHAIDKSEICSQLFKGFLSCFRPF